MLTRQAAGSPDPADVPAGIRIKGHPDQIKPIIEKLKAAVGDKGGIVKVDSSGDLVAVGTDPDYVAKLLEKGDLGAQASFAKVVPAAGQASSVLFVDFDAGGGWATKLADQLSGGNPDVKANLEPLDAFGISGWVDDDQVRARPGAAQHQLTPVDPGVVVGPPGGCGGAPTTRPGPTNHEARVDTPGWSACGGRARRYPEPGIAYREMSCSMRNKRHGSFLADMLRRSVTR